MRPVLRRFRDEIDPEAQGGAYLLGLRGLGVVAHGRFTRQGFAQAILHAQRGAAEDVVGRTHAAMAAAGVLKNPPASAA
jgi:glycerol-3-phosphate acyltransferase PlsX